MTQKIIRVGNSYALTIPSEMIKAYGISDARLVEVKTDIEDGKLIADFKSPNQKDIGEVIDQEVYKIAKQLLKRYLPAFKELAKR